MPKAEKRPKHAILTVSERCPLGAERGAGWPGYLSVQASCAHHTHTRLQRTLGGHIPRLKPSVQLGTRPLGSEKGQILARLLSFSRTSRQVFTLRPRNEGCCVVPPRIPLSNMSSGMVLHWLSCGGGSPSDQRPARPLFLRFFS